MTDIKNCVAIDKGALKMALNVLDRAGKKEVAEALRESCAELEELRAKAAAFDALSQSTYIDIINTGDCPVKVEIDGLCGYGKTLLEAINNAIGES